MSDSHIPAAGRRRAAFPEISPQPEPRPQPRKMGFAEAIRTCLRKYVTFSGRASRPEYWWFVLFLFLGGIVASALDAVLFPSAYAADLGVIDTLFSLGTFLPGLAAAWRRMHDTGRSGLYVLYPLIAMAGTASFAGFAGAFTLGSEAFTGLFGIVLTLAILVCVISPLIVIWWLTRPTKPEPNRWGPDPRLPAGEAFA